MQAEVHGLCRRLVRLEHSILRRKVISDVLASRQKSGYLFTYEPGPPQDGVIISYEVHADPVTPGTTGVRHFFTDQSGVIRVRMEGQATVESPPLS